MNVSATPQQQIAQQQLEKMHALSTFHPPTQGEVENIDKDGLNAFQDIVKLSTDKVSGKVAGAMSKICGEMSQNDQGKWDQAFVMRDSFSRISEGYPNYLSPSAAMAQIGKDIVLGHNVAPGSPELEKLEVNVVKSMVDVANDDYEKQEAQVALSQYNALSALPEQKAHAVDVLTQFMAWNAPQ